MRISQLYIKSFRGIPNDCRLSFVNKAGKPVSSIIYGGNGSGKSSVVDAIEYCLQGRIERSTALKNSARPSTVNFATEDLLDPYIEITFEDGTKLNRQIFVLQDEETGNFILTPSDILPHESYSKSPIVLRRNDIIQYNMTKEEQRQLLILQFLYDINIVAKLSQDPEIREIDKKVLDLKRKRESELEKISDILKLSIDDLKENINNIEQLIRARFCPKGTKLAFTSTGEPKKYVKEETFMKAIELSQGCRQISQQLNKHKKKRKGLVSINTPEKFKELENILREASAYLTLSFKEVSNLNYIEDIQLSIADVSKTSLAIRIKLVNGRDVTPNQIFSEANYDLMLLLLYISLIRVGVNSGQEKLLVLDDILQSVDANVRANFIAYILKELKDWQLFITCHDRLWLNQLKYLFNNVTHEFKEYHITNWSFTNGPVFSEENHLSTDETLKQAISTGNIRIVASMSGLFLEKICQELSVHLHCSIERKPEDKYTIADLWQSVKKNLRKTELCPLVEKIDKLVCIRNLLGCHYNQWAESFADDEVKDFAESVQELYEKCFCGNCNSWIEKSRVKGVLFECRCRNKTY